MYGDRQEPGLAEQVAKALVNKGFRLGTLGRSEAAIAVYDEVVSRYGDRQEPGLAEQVAAALGNKGWLEYSDGCYEESVAASRAALARLPQEIWIRCNLALALLHLSEPEEARELYAGVARAIETADELDRLAIRDLEDALAKHPDLTGAAEVLEKLRVRRSALRRGSQEPGNPGKVALPG